MKIYLNKNYKIEYKLQKTDVNVYQISGKCVKISKTIKNPKITLLCLDDKKYPIICGIPLLSTNIISIFEKT